MDTKNISQEIQVLLNQFNVRNFQLVLTKGKSLLKKNPEYVILYNLIGSSYQNLGDYINAKNYFENGLKLDSNNIALMNNLAMSYKNLLDYKLAEELYLKIIKLNNKYFNAYINLGNLKRDLNKFDEAIALYEKALSINDKSPVIYYSLALAHQGIGNFEKTNLYSKKALECDPKFTRADHLISQSTKYQDNSEHYNSLKEKLNRIDPNSLGQVDLYFSLAKAEEDIGNIKVASEYLIKGNKIKKKIINYDISNEIKLLKEIKEKFILLNNEVSTKVNNEKIIFILGMPRSGTSLVEQIITSHSEVFGGGELPILSNLIKYNFIKNNHLIEDFNKIIQDPLLLTNLNRVYLNFIKNFKYKEKFITDKAPLNFRWIGFIKLLFPNAKIIHCVRDPKNNCLSMFKNLFEGGLNFTYDQADLVTFYKQYQELMIFWKSKYSSNLLDVKYEDLISNNELEIKKIIKFCNLSWEEKCLSFYKNKTPIKTMSTAQARRPIYKSSLNGFDKFKNFLTIIEKEL
jgi:tetratricopeptide (TPR) repeat protein